MISTRNTCLYGSQPLSLVFVFKTATFGGELQVSMGPTHDLSFCACATACLASVKLVSIGPRLHLWFLHIKIARLAPESLVSIGPSPHVWFLDA